MARYKPCSSLGCPELAPQGQRDGRCDGCRGVAERRRGSAAERGYDATWRKVRADYLEQHPLCSTEHCLRLATDVDHIDGLGPHGPRGYDWSNLRALCHPHHSERTARDQPGGWHARQ